MFARALIVAGTTLATSIACISIADASCTVNPTPPTFGTYSPISGSTVTGTGSIAVTCTILTTATVSISTGSGTFAARTMLGPSNAKLTYNLYTNTGYTNVWGDGTAGTVSVSYSLTVLNPTQSLPVYGKIPASQDDPVGSYSDSLTVTVSF